MGSVIATVQVPVVPLAKLPAVAPPTVVPLLQPVAVNFVPPLIAPVVVVRLPDVVVSPAAEMVMRAVDAVVVVPVRLLLPISVAPPFERSQLKGLLPSATAVSSTRTPLAPDPAVTKPNPEIGSRLMPMPLVVKDASDAELTAIPTLFVAGKYIPLVGIVLLFGMKRFAVIAVPVIDPLNVAVPVDPKVYVLLLVVSPKDMLLIAVPVPRVTVM